MTIDSNYSLMNFTSTIDNTYELIDDLKSDVVDAGGEVYVNSDIYPELEPIQFSGDVELWEIYTDGSAFISLEIREGDSYDVRNLFFNEKSDGILALKGILDDEYVEIYSDETPLDPDIVEWVEDRRADEEYYFNTKVFVSFRNGALCNLHISGWSERAEESLSLFIRLLRENVNDIDVLIIERFTIEEFLKAFLLEEEEE